MEINHRSMEEIRAEKKSEEERLEKAAQERFTPAKRLFRMDKEGNKVMAGTRKQRRAGAAKARKK